MAGRIAVVDSQDSFLRWAERKEVHARRLVHRSVHVLVFDRAGRLLVQRRHPDKDVYPGHWDTSCAGHVEESDYPGGPNQGLDGVYAAVAARELGEELGVQADLEELGHFAPVPNVHYEQIRLFRAVHDGPFVLQAGEVSAVRPVTRPEFLGLQAIGAPVTPSLIWFVDWLHATGLWE
ncbi:MAG: NUDIX domain-containing protein [Planctomycetota bacterium]|nr:MAG: NUDIX domain-containing protein [Planctomycetota bacterium]